MATTISRDCLDINSDIQNKSTTFPIKYGIKKSSYFASIVFGLSFVFALFAFGYNIVNIYVLTPLVSCIVILLCQVFGVSKNHGCLVLMNFYELYCCVCLLEWISKSAM